MARKTKLKRIGKRVSLVEGLFKQLPTAHRTRVVFLTIANAAGIPEKDSHERFALALALLPERASSAGEAAA